MKNDGITWFNETKFLIWGIVFQTRTVPGAVEKMEEILHWAGLVPDESKYGTFMYEITSCFSVFFIYLW